jgi:hypothetical protein
LASADTPYRITPSPNIVAFKGAANAMAAQSGASALHTLIHPTAATVHSAAAHIAAKPITARIDSAPLDPSG